MRKFDQHLDFQQLMEACGEAGFFVDDTAYLNGGDFVHFHFVHEASGVEAEVHYNTVTGWAYGNAYGPGGGSMEFNTSSPHDGQPWFDALIDFIYRSSE